MSSADANTTVPPLNIHQRMLAVMRDINYVQKTDKTVNGQYRFVTHDAVTAKVRESLCKHGIVSLITVERHAQDGNRTEADVRVEFVNVDEPVDRVTIHAFGYGIDPQDKGPGKAVSYAVKYAYLKAFALETGDDPEKDSIEHKPDERKGAGYEKHTARQVAVDAFDAQTPEEQQFLRDTAIEIIAMHEGGGDVCAFVEKQHFDTEQKLAIWSLLPSNVRSAIKKQARNGLASQP